MPRLRVGVTGGVPTVLGGHRGGVLAHHGPRVPRGKRNPGRRVRPSRGWPKPRSNPARGSSGCGSPRRALRAEGQLRPGYLLLREKKVFLRGKRGKPHEWGERGARGSPSAQPPALPVGAGLEDLLFHLRVPSPPALEIMQSRSSRVQGEREPLFLWTEPAIRQSH